MGHNVLLLILQPRATGISFFFTELFGFFADEEGGTCGYL